MKISILIIGIILFFLGSFSKTNYLIAAGIILIIISFFGKSHKKQEKQETSEKKEPKTKRLCSNCEAEIHSDDNYCPECGKKILP